MITYTSRGPGLEGRSGFFLRTRLMWRELWMARGLIWRLFLRDFSVRYRQTVFGITWAIIMPVVTVGMFVSMNRSGILAIEEVGVPYPLYAVIGLSIWNFFTIGLVNSTNSLVEAGSMVVKINFPKVALVIAATGQGIVELLIRMVLVALIFLWYGVFPHPTGLFIGLIGLVPLYLLMVGMGFVLSLAAAVLRDIVNVLNVVLVAVMLLTPILYPIGADTMLGRVNQLNPINYLVNVPRDFILRGGTEHGVEFVVAALFSIMVFYTGWKLFHLAQTKIAERV